VIIVERHFDEELRHLKDEILRMGSLVEEAVSRAVRGLVDRDSSKAESVVQADEAINMLELEIEEECLRLLALRQPAAADLRFIVMVLKINNDLERMGDLAVNIAERAIELVRQPVLKPLLDIPRMAQLTQAMVKDCLDAFVQANADRARSICLRDDQVDKLNDQIFRELLTYIMQDPTATTRAVDLILVGRHLERIADHATNISEDVIYMVQGKTIKHHIEEKQHVP